MDFGLAERKLKQEYERRFWKTECRGKRWRMFRCVCNGLELYLRRCEEKCPPQGMDIDAFEKRWIEEFAADVPEKKLDEYHVRSAPEGYGHDIWHVFSRELIPKERYLTGDDARRAYMAADKEGAGIIEGHWAGGKLGALPPVFQSPRVTDVICTEVYVVGRDFEWTYIKTHEGDFFGPYFCRKTK